MSTTYGWHPTAWLVLLLLSSPLHAAVANPLQDATRDIDSAVLRFSFAAREGVQGDGNNISIHSGSSTVWRTNRHRSSLQWCDPCDLQVTLTYRDGEVRKVRWRVGADPDRVTPDVQDLGRVDATQGRDLLMDLVRNSEDRVAEKALEAAVLSEAQVPWRELLQIARDAERTKDLRSTALFWLGQEAQEAVTAELEEFVGDDVEDRDVRQAAIFALSQRPERESIPSLERIVRQHRDAEMRRNALFWLAQIDAPEVMDFFEEILSESSSR